jgi:hypothetical protein
MINFPEEATVRAIMKLMIIKNPVAEVVHQTVNKVMVSSSSCQWVASCEIANENLAPGLPQWNDVYIKFH